MTDGFEHRWESQTVLRGWQFAYVGQMLMMLKPSSARTVCSTARQCTPRRARCLAAVAAGLAGGPPCPLVVEGSLPPHKHHASTAEQCLLAAVDGVSRPTSVSVQMRTRVFALATAPTVSSCTARRRARTRRSKARLGPSTVLSALPAACDRCRATVVRLVHGSGRQCIRSIDGKMGECRTGKLGRTTRPSAHAGRGSRLHRPCGSGGVVE